MGYSYDEAHRLCCDNCGKAGGVTKRKCPFGYCLSPAYCHDCAEKRRYQIGREAHIKRGCLLRHAEYVNLEAERTQMQVDGQFVRCSALGVGNEVVHVIFERKEGHGIGYIGRYMSSAIYKSIPLMANATTWDYEALGECEVAPGHYQ